MTDDQFELEVTLNGILSGLQVKIIDQHAEDLIEDAVDRIVALIAQREAEARKETKHLVEVNLYTNAIRVASVNDQTVGENNDYYITLQQLEYLMQQAVLAELERRHDG